jgi:hypothetical protein
MVFLLIRILLLILILILILFLILESLTLPDEFTVVKSAAGR